jgi:[CysO sulfur-carrier protein]-S-L-cysteine hydrolase
MLEFSTETLDQIFAHAQAEFPDECCGIILSDGVQEFVRQCRNIQNQRHAEDPETYPRDARTAYLIDPNDLIKIHKEAETENRPIKAFYHSHPDHDAYFSEKDKADAMMWDEPTYPDAAYVVISIYDRDVKTTKAFAWRETLRDFTEVPIQRKGD